MVSTVIGAIIGFIFFAVLRLFGCYALVNERTAGCTATSRT